MLLLEGLFLYMAFALVAAIIVWEIVWERGVAAFVTMIIGGFAIWYLSGAVNLLPWLRDNWDTILFVTMGYVVVGGLWAILNWRLFFLPDSYEEYEQWVPTWKSQWNDWEAPKRDYPSQDAYVEAKAKDKGFPPLISTHKADFFYWMWWWPPHAFWTLAHKPIQRISRWFYDAVAAMLNRMSSDYFDKRKANG